MQVLRVIAGVSCPNEGGWVAVYPCGTNPNVSNLNFINGWIGT